jgi:hypothetical protein
MTILSVFWGGDSNHDFKEPGSNDLRSPCPFLNTLANHGYINRDGKHVTWWSTTTAIHNVYHLSWFVAGLLSLSGVFTGLVMNWNPFWFDLGVLRTHKSYLVESDASLTRGNWPGNNWEPDETLVKEILDKASSPVGLGHEGFAEHRVAQEAKLNYKVGVIRNTIGTGNCGIIIPTIGRGSDIPEERKISPAWAKSFFAEGRLPSDWSRQKHLVTIDAVNTATSLVKNQMEKIRLDPKIK